MSRAASFMVAALRKLDSVALLELSERAGVPHAIVMRAANGANGQATRADHYLRMCAVLGLNPATWRNGAAPYEPGELHTYSFACAIRMSRFRKKQNVRQAAKSMGISASSLCRMERAQPVSFECMYAACRYGALNPNWYVSRETTRNTAIAA